MPSFRVSLPVPAAHEASRIQHGDTLVNAQIEITHFVISGLERTVKGLARSPKKKHGGSCY
jgi:hypothetical protein